MKSLLEIKEIVRKFSQAKGVGFTIAPQLMKIAMEVGLPGYEDGLLAWAEGSVRQEETYNKGEVVPVQGLTIAWDGPAFLKKGPTMHLGIEATLKMIDECLKLEQP